MSTMEALCRKLVRLYALALDLPEDHFDALLREPHMILRQSRYPLIDAADDKIASLVPHTNSGFMTLLPPNKVQGLSINLPNGEWHGRALCRGRLRGERRRHPAPLDQRALPVDAAPRAQRLGRRCVTPSRSSAIPTTTRSSSACRRASRSTTRRSTRRSSSATTRCGSPPSATSTCRTSRRRPPTRSRPARAPPKPGRAEPMKLRLIATSSAGRSRTRLPPAMIGNVLEWYDFSIYGFFAASDRRDVLPERRPGRPRCWRRSASSPSATSRARSARSRSA